VLEQRLKSRREEPEVIKRRMAEAAAEISHWAEYDYVIINSDLETSVAGLRAILAAERLRRERLLGLSEFVREMQKSL